MDQVFQKPLFEGLQEGRQQEDGSRTRKYGTLVGEEWCEENCSQKSHASPEVLDAAANEATAVEQFVDQAQMKMNACEALLTAGRTFLHDEELGRVEMNLHLQPRPKVALKLGLT